MYFLFRFFFLKEKILPFPGKKTPNTLLPCALLPQQHYANASLKAAWSHMDSLCHNLTISLQTWGVSRLCPYVHIITFCRSPKNRFVCLFVFFFSFYNEMHSPGIRKQMHLYLWNMPEWMNAGRRPWVFTLLAEAAVATVTAACSWVWPTSSWTEEENTHLTVSHRKCLSWRSIFLSLFS